MNYPNTFIIKDINGKEKVLIQLKDGDWMDQEGTRYPASNFDEGLCGVFPFETGKWDPFWKAKTCPSHDKAFNRLKAGYLLPNESNWSVFKEFSRNIALGMIDGAYSVVAGPIYLVLGGLGGALRWAQLGGK